MTMKEWMTTHHGQMINTEQYDKERGTTWEPGLRKVDAGQRAGTVFLGGSAREYRGMRVVEYSDDLLTVEDDWHKITYTVESPERANDK